MYCSASATLWTKSSCLITAMPSPAFERCGKTTSIPMGAFRPRGDVAVLRQVQALRNQPTSRFAALLRRRAATFSARAFFHHWANCLMRHEQFAMARVLRTSCCRLEKEKRDAQPEIRSACLDPAARCRRFCARTQPRHERRARLASASAHADRIVRRDERRRETRTRPRARCRPRRNSRERGSQPRCRRSDGREPQELAARARKNASSQSREEIQGHGHELTQGPKGRRTQHRTSTPLCRGGLREFRSTLFRRPAAIGNCQLVDCLRRLLRKCHQCHQYHGGHRHFGVGCRNRPESTGLPSLLRHLRWNIPPIPWPGTTRRKWHDYL